MLHNGANPCQGYVRIFMQGKWGVVGSDGWTSANEDVVCKSIGCGTSQRSIDMPLSAEDRALVWLNNLNCTGNEPQLWECPGGPGPGLSTYTKDKVKKITCTGDTHTAPPQNTLAWPDLFIAVEVHGPEVVTIHLKLCDIA